MSKRKTHSRMPVEIEEEPKSAGGETFGYYTGRDGNGNIERIEDGVLVTPFVPLPWHYVYGGKRTG